MISSNLSFNKKIFNYKFFFNISLIFILLLLIEGYLNHYHYLFNKIIPLNSTYNTLEKYSSSHSGMDKIKNFIWEENGVIENIQVFFLLFSIYFFFIFLKRDNQINFKFSKISKIIFFLGIVYFFLEEISWGQHFFHWKTPSIFNSINEQQETNLHNINSFFNQLPRNLILIWSSLTFLIIKLKFLNLNKLIVFFIYPSNNLKKISFLILFFTLPKLLFENYLDLANILEDNINQKIVLKWNGIVAKEGIVKFKIFILDFLNFKFVRISELQEMLFTYYILYTVTT